MVLAVSGFCFAVERSGPAVAVESIRGYARTANE